MLTPRLPDTSAFGIIPDVAANCAMGGFGPTADKPEFNRDLYGRLVTIENQC